MLRSQFSILTSKCNRARRKEQYFCTTLLNFSDTQKERRINLKALSKSSLRLEFK
jgi:hypothetical protein